MAFFPFAHLRLMPSRILAWSRSLNAKLFMAMAILTSFLALGAAFFIIGSFRASIESYAKGIALNTARGVVEDIARLDPGLRFRRETAEILAAWVHPESVSQIDIFTAAKIDDENHVEVWATSKGSPEEVAVNYAEILEMLDMPEERADFISLDGGEAVWRVYVPIAGGYAGAPRVLLRAYCNLGRWGAVWKNTYWLTLKALPMVLLAEFVILWLLTSFFVRRPMRKILAAMLSLGKGEASARANFAAQDELGQIALHFNAMAGELQKMGHERESLLDEIKGFNATLQGRIEEALSELVAKNAELQLLMERIALLREELGQQERLAVAGQLTAVFAHEVGTPLNLVNSHLQLLLGEPGLDGAITDRLGTIRSQIDRVGEIVKKMLGHTRPIELNIEIVKLHPLLEDLLRLWQPALSVRGASMYISVPSSCDLHADRKQVEQLFLNLVNNAADAMPKGGAITIECAQSQPSMWDLSVSDTGVGVPPANLASLFKPMFTTKPEGKGTGLGLAICREIVRAHGGEISIESAEGQGATVRFTLPSAER
jgi:signal transduction histidine kinase